MNLFLSTILGYRTFAAPPPPGIPAPFTSMAADGWQQTVGSPTDLTLAPYSVDRAHFTATGAGSYRETHYQTKRVRQAFPNQASFTADKVAGSRFLYPTDTLTGATNNSTLTSPKPNGRWLMPRYPLVGNSILLSLEAFHKDARLGRQVHSVEFEIFDVATSTLQQSVVVSDTVTSTVCEDAHSVRAFEQSVNITALADGLYYVDVNIFAWTGDVSTVRTSQDSPVRRDFERIYFTKNVSRFNAPPVAYVNSTGNDGTGVWSTVDATAQANKFATETGAMNAIQGSAATGGVADGCILYFDNGTHTIVGPGGTVAVPQNSAAMTYRRSAGSTNRALVILQFGTAAFDPHLGINVARNGSTLTAPIAEGILNIQDVTLDRTGASSFARAATGTAVVPMLYQFVNVTLDNNAQTARWLNSADVRCGIFGMVFVTDAGNNALLGGGSAVEYILQRGIVCTNMRTGAFDGFSVVGCSMANCGGSVVADNTLGMIVSHSSFPGMTTSFAQENWVSSTVVDRFHFLNVMAEYVSTVTTNVGLSLGGTSGSTVGMTLHHCSFIGAQNCFRCNIGYDNQASTASNEQTHYNLSIVGFYCGQINIKGDVFRGDPAGADGNFAAVHGVDWEGIYSMYAANSIATEHPSYPGLNSSLGTSDTLPQASEASLVVSYQGVTAPAGVLTAGAGGGDYTPAAMSPLLGRVTTRNVCDTDLAGNARSTTSPAGAFV